jgi:hypothetical protein
VLLDLEKRQDVVRLREVGFGPEQGSEVGKLLAERRRVKKDLFEDAGHYSPF